MLAKLNIYENVYLFSLYMHHTNMATHALVQQAPAGLVLHIQYKSHYHKV
jgi:hypothetical protein